MTADLRALYSRDTDDQAVLRPLTETRPPAVRLSYVHSEPCCSMPPVICTSDM